jgi:hypothetical protein
MGSKKDEGRRTKDAQARRASSISPNQPQCSRDKLKHAAAEFDVSAQAAAALMSNGQRSGVLCVKSHFQLAQLHSQTVRAVLTTATDCEVRRVNDGKLDHFRPTVARETTSLRAVGNESMISLFHIRSRFRMSGCKEDSPASTASMVTVAEHDTGTTDHANRRPLYIL